MTKERAIEKQKQLIDYLKYCLEIGSDCCLLDEDKKMIISALEYRTPKKPKVVSRIRGGFRNYTCSKCGHTEQKDERYEIKEIYCSVCGKIVDGTFGNFCGNCGQAIDKT